MSGFVVIVDRGGLDDPAAALSRARAALCAGAPGAAGAALVRAPFAAWAAGGGDRAGRAGLATPSPAGTGADARVRFAGGFSIAWEPDRALLAACAAALREPERDLPALPSRPAGRRALFEWNPDLATLTLVSEPNGLRPVYVHDGAAALVLASEPKAVPAALGTRAEPDADAIADLWTLGHCAGLRTPFRGVALAPPGTAIAWGPRGRIERAWEPPRFSERRDADSRVLARAFADALVETLRAVAAHAPRARIALSGGMDSRVVLAGARRAWPAPGSITFGAPGSADARLGAALAARAGLANDRYLPDDGFLEHWAPWVAWRGDGMLSCVHGHGMDAVLATVARMGAAPGTHDGEPGPGGAAAAGSTAGGDTPPVAILNGIGGDFLMGAFLRPDHLRGVATPERATAFVLESRRFHANPLERVLKPELLRARALPAEEVLRGVFAPLRGRRFGNALITYWLRHYAPRITAVGIGIEDAWADPIGPLVDPHVIEAARHVPLELRFMSRTYRRALADLAPELAGIRWERTGAPPAWPWPAHAAVRLARRLGVLPRPRPAVDHVAAMRGPAASWLRATLLERRTLADGYLLPEYLTRIVADHLSGRASHTAELSMALTLELWRRAFVEGDGPPAELPPLPEPVAAR